MTQKDYTLVATALKEAKPRPLDARIPNAKAKYDAALDTWRTIIRSVAAACKEQSPNFKAGLFYTACGDNGD